MARATRRTFLKTSAITTAGFWVAGGLRADDSRSANERIQFASIGIGGKGDSDSLNAARLGDMVAVCDIDTQRLEQAARKLKAKDTFVDFREMLDTLGDKIDAVTISTPDHTHAPAAAMAMKLGKHCFCQKPLTHSIFEARELARLAKEHNVATQMGNQGTSNAGLREAAAMIQAGVLGDVSEVHVWTDRPIWPQGNERPDPTPKPDHVEWDLWVGPAPMREYATGYHPFKWRGYWDFGTGSLGDMACHIMNMPFMGLDLRNPISVEAETPGHNGDSFPRWSTIRYEFAANDKRPALTLYWYDGTKMPNPELFLGADINKNGALVVGEKGTLYSPEPYGREFKLLGGAQPVKVDFVKSRGHVREWVDAIKGGEPAVSNFPDYAGPLTETVLLGNLAVWSGKKAEWDAEKMEAKNAPELASIVRREYREGYTL
ncbi:MAG: gfo/Idh/MocA family oxidoreductase [Planctomycetota bacterium]|nr:MAG: gfo/Idh/MocA family oxidoreductase [Planctomycetota bacterium]